MAAFNHSNKYNANHICSNPQNSNEQINNDTDKEKYKQDLQKPRGLLGKEQLQWVSKRIDKEYRWSIFGQQLLIGPKYLPGIFKSDKLDRINKLNKFNNLHTFNLIYLSCQIYLICLIYPN